LRLTAINNKGKTRENGCVELFPQIKTSGDPAEASVFYASFAKAIFTFAIEKI